MARGEFSIVVAGLAVGVEPRIGPLATAYVLILVVVGPLTARWTEPLARKVTGRPETPVEPSRRGPGRPGRSYSGALHLDALNHARSTVCGSTADGMGAGV